MEVERTQIHLRGRPGILNPLMIGWGWEPNVQAYILPTILKGTPYHNSPRTTANDTGLYDINANLDWLFALLC